MAGTSPRSYQEDLQNQVGRLDRVLSKDCRLVWNTVMPGAAVVSGDFLPPEDQPEARACGPMFWRPTSAALWRPAGMAETCWTSMSTADKRGSTDWDEHTHLHLFHLLLAHLADAWAMHLPAAATWAGGSGRAPRGEFRALWVKAARRLWA